MSTKINCGQPEEEAAAFYRISWPINTHPDFFVWNFRKYNDECILILVIYWKKTGLLRMKISNHNTIYSS
jgi:hypothetical protein